MTYLSLKTKSCILVLAISALLVSCLVAPAAAREYSIWEWWTNQAKDVTDTTPIPPPWGAAYAAWTHDQVWDQQDIVVSGSHKESWTVPVVPFASTVLRVEYAGWAPFNKFGWYNPADGSGPTVMNQIFGGSAGPGDSFLVDFSGYEGETIGFYVEAKYGDMWYSEAGQNSDGKTHVRVFDHPTTSNSWVLAWEDRPMTFTGYDYDAAWVKGNEPLKWYDEIKEPDYNDMILTFEWVKTPELSTFALLGLSLAVVPVLRRRRRS